MKLIKVLAHLFIPHESNNQKARIIQPGPLSIIVFLLIAFQILISIGNKAFPKVLGYAANISPTDVVRLTNEQRTQSGLSPLTLNLTLSQAAQAKGQDMLSKGYWAHFAPDGTSPWSFFLSFGYKYRYAGENLARDFSDASSAVSAWMNSPSHRDNILNANYKEVGIGVVEGSLAGTDTTIIVQFFAAPLTSVPSIPLTQAKEISTTAPSTPKPVIAVEATPVPSLSPSPAPLTSVATNYKASPFGSTRGISLTVLAILLLVFAVDLIIVRRKRIARIGGKTLAHIAFLAMILAVVLILKAGQII